MSYKHAFYIVLAVLVAVVAFGFAQQPEVIVVVEYRDIPVLVHDINTYQFRNACEVYAQAEPVVVEEVAPIGNLGLVESFRIDDIEIVDPVVEEAHGQFRYRLCEDSNGSSVLCEAPASHGSSTDIGHTPNVTSHVPAQKRMGK